ALPQPLPVPPPSEVRRQHLLAVALHVAQLAVQGPLPVHHLLRVGIVAFLDA
ncbi:unnamed protein product, partial [Urochloa humidicola]